MRNLFNTSLDETLKWEGGYSNHPDDPGGSTMKGVTQARYDGYRKDHGLPTRSVKNIQLDEVRTIYRKYYWDVVKGDLLPSGVDLAVFDFAVNSGPSRAAEYLQKIVKVEVDGKIGPATLEAVSRQNPRVLIETLCDKRLAFLQRLSIWPTFGKGWGRRVAGIRKAALKLSDYTPVVSPTPGQKVSESPLSRLIKWVLSFLS